MLTDLLRKRSCTAAYFSEKFNISPRTVYRYVEILSSAFPVTIKRGRNGGIRLSDAFCLPVGYLTEEDFQAMQDALETAYATTLNERFLRAQHKLTAEKKQAEHTSVFAGESGALIVDKGGFGNVYALKDKIRVFGECIRERFLADVTYLNENGERTELKIEPHALVFKQNAWYVYAFCHKLRSFKLYALGRTLSAVKWEERFQKRPFTQEDLGFASTPPPLLSVRLEITSAFTERAIEIFGAENVRVGKEKTVAEIEMPDDNDLILKILSLGNGVKAVSPDSLRNKLLRHAESLVQLYKD